MPDWLSIMFAFIGRAMARADDGELQISVNRTMCNSRQRLLPCSHGEVSGLHIVRFRFSVLLLG